MNPIKTYIKSLWAAWSDFWFKPQDLFRVSLFRVLLGSVLTLMYAIRLLDVELYYFNTGMMSVQEAKQFYFEFFDTWIFAFPESDAGIRLFHWVFVLGLLGMTLGVIGRGLTWVLFFIHVGLLQRNYAVVYGADSVTVFWLLYLSLCNHNRYFNLLSRIWPKYREWKQRATESDVLTTIGVRLIQIQVCVIYAYTGWEKLRGSQWWDGTAVWHVMGNVQLVPVDLSFFVYFPWLIAVMTFATVMFEVYFPVAILHPLTRPMWLLLGLALHGLAGVFMGLFFFSANILTTYVFFVQKDQIASFKKWLQKRGLLSKSPASLEG